MDLPNLRWIHLTSAGYERYVFADFRHALQKRRAILTNSSSVYDEPCAEHLLAMILTLARQLPRSFDVQCNTRDWPSDDIRKNSHLLSGQTAVLLGYGAIARRLCDFLVPLRLNLIAVRRQLKGDEPIRTVTESELPHVLPYADHVLNILPGGRETQQFVSAARIADIKPGAIFYNVGRGSTVDQDALIAALESGHLAAAYLDVTDPEPLPPHHRLWKAPNCYITPHTAGGHANEFQRLVKHFLSNLGRFEIGEDLIDQIV